MFARLFCLIALHRPDMRFRWSRGHRVVHCSDCGRELVERSRGRWRPALPQDFVH